MKNGEVFDATIWISQSDAAKIRGVSRQAIANLVKKDRFRTLLIGGKTLLHREDVEAYQGKVPGPEPKSKRQRKPKAVQKDVKRASPKRTK